MQLAETTELTNHIVEESEVLTRTSKNNFIEANTQKVELEHLKKDCIIPVFSKDNETTISHYEFINRTKEIALRLFPEFSIGDPDIRVSHMIKGRIPSAIGKPVKELLSHEKTIYYERCAFIIEMKQAKETIGNNELTLSIGGVRAYNQENLYSKKSPEKFKLFLGYKNTVCTNLCISTDGFSNEIRVSTADELEPKIEHLIESYNREEHLQLMKDMESLRVKEEQFAHLIGRLRMYQHLNKDEQKQLPQFGLNDGQINSVVKDYYHCPNFSKKQDGSISLWRLYNLFTEANKSSYIDNNLERNVGVYEFINMLAKSIKNQTECWYLPII